MSAERIVLAVLVGIIQGVFEWLPISSEGNVAIVLRALGRSAEDAVGFALFLHLGTAASATAYYRDEFATLLDDAPDGGNVIIDPMIVLEESGPEYWQFLADLKETVVEREGLALLHCLNENSGSSSRAITEYVSDVVFQLSTTRQGDKIENQLAVPKFRGGAPLEDVIKLRMTTTVDVDISRNLV
jgi:hypothetical protein